MEHSYLLTIDLGTSSCKTALWSDAGQLVAETAQAYTLQRPDPVWAEIDANVWWDAICTTVRQVVAQAGINKAQIAGIGVDGIGWTLVPVDSQCNPLCPAMSWLDRRAAEEAAWLNALPEADHLVELCANPIDPAYITPKILWLKKHHPELFAAAYKFLTSSGFIVARLTGEFTCDYTQAYGYHFLTSGASVGTSALLN